MVIIKAILESLKESLDKHKIIRGTHEVLSQLLLMASTKLMWHWRQTGMEDASNSIVIRHQMAWYWFSAGKDQPSLCTEDMCSFWSTALVSAKIQVN